MTPAVWISVLTLLGAFGLLATTRLRPHLVLTGALAVMVLTGVVGVKEALGGLSNEGVVTIALLFVVAAGLTQTNALALPMRRVLGSPRSDRDAQARLSSPVMLGSAFLNNTPIVAMLLPVVIDWCRRAGIAPSKVLLPLSYLAILGGMCTVMGTSTSLAVHGLLIDGGWGGLSLFALSPVGFPCALVGALFLVVFAPRLLPSRDDARVFEDPRRYTVEMVVGPRSPVAGQTIETAGLRHLPGLFLMEVHRDDEIFAAVSPTQLLQEGDQLIFVGDVASVVELQRMPGLAPATRQVFELESHRSQRVFAEAVIASRNPLVGETIRAGRFRNRYGAVVLGVSREGERVEGRIGDIVLRPGDTLFLEGDRDFVQRWQSSADFYLVRNLDGRTPPVNERAPVALAILCALVLVVAVGGLPLLHAALLAAAAMLLSGCCSEPTARASLDGPLLLALVAAFGLGQAMTSSGAAAVAADGLAAASGPNPWVALCLLYLVATLLSEVVTNNAAAVLLFPVAESMSQAFAVSIVPFAVALIIGASASFASPIGYQTNLMVYGPGGYRFGDFLRLGLPLKAVVSATALSAIYLAHPGW